VLATVALAGSRFAVIAGGITGRNDFRAVLRLLCGGLTGSAGSPTTALSLARRTFGGIVRCIVKWARSLADTAGGGLRSGLARIAGLPATLAFAAPGFFSILAPCRRRPVRLRLYAAFGVFHVRFSIAPRKFPEGMQLALIRFCVAARLSVQGEIAKFFLFVLRIPSRSPSKVPRDFFQNRYLQSASFWL
jgi:hypothetical protein